MNQLTRLFVCVVPWLLVIASSCSSEKAFVRVSVFASEGEFKDVKQLEVQLTSDLDTDTLFYPKAPTASVRLDTTTPVTFSVSFATSREGPLKVRVILKGAGDVEVGWGDASLTTIDPDDVNDLKVFVTRGPPPDRDAGVQDAPVGDAGDAGAGSDALALSCSPTVPSTCTAGRTCNIGCRPDGTAASICARVGNKQPGERCTDDELCTAGSQCFKFEAATCAARGQNDPVPTSCLKYCMSDADCGGGGSRCLNPVQCGAGPTPYKFCSRPCDPTGTAMNGCAAGLFCIVTPGEIPDCNCRTTTQVGTDGSMCTTNADCVPGTICVDEQLRRRVCRPVCRLSAPSCAAGRTCEKLVMPDYQTFGACLP